MAYYLYGRQNIDVVCFVRSSYSEVYFELMGIPCERIDLRDDSALKARLAGLDVVLDFSFPKGQLFALERAALDTIEPVVSSMRRGATYIYMSSIMAFGMKPDEKYVRDCRISRSPYSRIKRGAERAALRAGAANGVSVYNFRLGQVHGVLQSVSLAFRERLATEAATRVDGNRWELTNTIFPSSIADAVIKCVEGGCRPGTYALVSSPQWTLEELYGYYADYYDLKPNLVYEPQAPAKRNRISWRGGIFRALAAQRPLLEAYVLMNSPLLSTKLKGRYRVAELLGAPARMRSRIGGADAHLLGMPPAVLATSNSSVEIVKRVERTFDRHYQEAVFRGRS
ncbi:NAD-dependent epimerase/dehydratase family protein [Usitatibacter rugosus]|uniref:NAD-dependent epimerase/dehydratase family protein n=1 Tax=Usitatibacter rugosus TaxID=2732067 RepID=UPI0014882B1D